MIRKFRRRFGIRDSIASGQAREQQAKAAEVELACPKLPLVSCYDELCPNYIVVPHINRWAL